VVEGEVKNKTEFGLFLGLDGDVDGMVHLSDLDWKRPGEQVIEEYKKGDKVKAQVLDVDVEKERISLGIKQLEGAPPAAEPPPATLKKGAVVTCEVTEVKEGGIDVKIVGTEFTSFIKRSELARDRSEQRPDRFAVGQKVDARVIQFDRRPQGRSRSRRSKSPRRRRRSRNTARPIPARRWATSSAPRSSARARRESERTKRGDERRGRREEADEEGRPAE
jgi:small subunit ribosomal protein S1